ncbi:bifunctional aldolase/short-chain dehydrogenase [Terribacillus saccharophilus]|uniref:Bifunctional rhamnulose-1-phosphate aldolase/short-chain dehydrogenase n=1 Tax=Terribacillus saccharophilus TaxID=361277 RepID=A0ABX4H277_9BACI|nr:bifunctional aldolase/short-chain dehydrogenase [Terribacillus saccharophilus]PAD36865.1 bifunctional rhamnulose-1-phosphate aldolase/short-chain dehydrogenase [Terribacillus saccharophilus]PAD97848.1 bifunctional rhamnulose-1-phosphate aldolase/short-chain dehydrogenase [Terribacillus saccharophilus]PAE01230.1 bifunctional rhamnulose-1-phosphate aldolase/short-chain dehydrogenase [Terribacillus saccharophilus]
MVQNKWNESNANHYEGLGELVYRSNLIGSDRSVCNWGGGNTSMKTTVEDFRGRPVEVMYVKGSGSDLATMGAHNFTGLRMEDIRPLIERDSMSDEEMVSYLSQCMIDASHPRASIETLLHAFLPYKHVDHSHPDSIISLCCADNGQEIAKEIFGERFVWVPYIRPGFTLSKMIAEAVAANPQAELVLMEKHGLVVWGETAKESYDRTIAVINEAESYISQKQSETKAFSGEKFSVLDKDKRNQLITKVMPAIRGAVSGEKKMILSFDDSVDVLEFVNSEQAQLLSQVGAACPDHLVHTKRTPLYIAFDPSADNADDLLLKVEEGIQNFAKDYEDYFSRLASEGDVMFEPVPRVVLIPGVGMVTTGKDKKAADISAALYHRAIAVMKGATALGDFVSLSESESFAVEYWPLELYKLSLAPPEARFSRSVVLVTGGAGGIGSATLRVFLEGGAHAVVTDINLEGAEKVAQELNETYGAGRAIAVKMDVTDESAIAEAFEKAVRQFGGVDHIINNAGLATSSPFDETTLKEWQLNMDVLGTGYFLVAREAFRLMKQQGIGGSMVFVGSKNSVYAGKNAAAYSAVKAMEMHLARCIAAEGGSYGIRVNGVLPDAVLQGSAIWGSKWREERAAAYNISPDELEEHYRKRTTLGVNIYPSDIAESIAFFASDAALKTTGCMITVDGGVPAAFTR